MIFRWYLLLLYQHVKQVIATSSTASSFAANNSVCPSRTANYLTHTLPQQCLTSSRSAVTTPAVTSTSDIVTGTNTETASSTGNSPDQAASTSTDLPEKPRDETVSTSKNEPSVSQTTVLTVVATPVGNKDLGPALPEIIEEESPLESGNFLSFEEWKKQNLEKAGQSEHVGRDANAETSREGRKRPMNLQQSLDSLGDEVEIDLDFSGFVPGGPETPYAPSSGSSESGPDRGADGGAAPNVVPSRKKDAGTTCKERFNYASFDCAASMLKTNPQAKSPGSVLSENKDAYMLNECSAENKFIIIELCNDILVDTVVLANFEFFSSIFRTFRVSVSDRYPAKQDKWKSLGLFEARNSRDVQAFLVEDPMIWARYLRVEFLTHYGSEFYCPVSLIRVHGTTMLEEYKHDMESAAGDDEDEAESAVHVEEEEEDKLVPEAIDQGLWEKEKQRQEELNAAGGLSSISNQTASATERPAVGSNVVCPTTEAPANASSGTGPMLFDPAFNMCADREEPQISATSSLTKASSVSEPPTGPSTTSSTVAMNSTSTDKVDTQTTTETVSAHGTSVRVTESVSVEIVSQVVNSTQTTSPTKDSASATPSTTPSGASNESFNNSAAKPEEVRPSTQSSNSTERPKTVVPSPSERLKQSSSATQSTPASPTMQESFFKSVQKRLQMLESNSSLSLQYIEEQSRALRDAFKKVEQRQLSKTTIFLDHLNSTVLKELREFRQQYDQLWQSTVIELEIQREQYQRENQAMHARLGVLADELIFQKRMSILQMTMILVCLGLVLFSRGAINNYLELPLVQSVLSRSSSSRWMNLSSDSPSSSPKLGRARTTFQIGPKPGGILKGHRRLQSDDSNITENLSQGDLYSPPTPVSFDGYSDANQSALDDVKMVSDPEYDPESIERPSTSPPTLTISTPEQTTPRLSAESQFTSLESKIATPGSNNVNPSLPDQRSAPASPPKSLKWNLPDLDD